MKYLCSYVLALANNSYRAVARHLAGYKPAPRVDDKLQLEPLPYPPHPRPKPPHNCSKTLFFVEQKQTFTEIKP